MPADHVEAGLGGARRGKGGDGKTGGGVYLWPTLQDAQKAHDEAWRQSIIKRIGSAPTIRYFDLFLLIDNEKGTFTEFPEAAEITPAAA